MSVRRFLVLLLVVMPLLAYAASVPILVWGDLSLLLRPTNVLDYLLLVVGFGAGLVIGVMQVMRVLRQYTQALHDLSGEDAEALTGRLVFGLFSQSGQGATLGVQSGQVDLDGPPVVHKVGGPAWLDVDHNSVVVTSRLGRLNRVLGPGVHALDEFERLWDVVDLRPQRRTITVNFMTRDGIPASCQASIVCRVASGEPTALNGAVPPFGYAPKAVLKLTTSKEVVKHEGAGGRGDRIADWVSVMSKTILANAVRDAFEECYLDELLNPRYGLEEENTPAPRLLPELETEIESRVRTKGAQLGVIVERIELGVVRPSEEAISRQWLEFWQARLQRSIDTYTLEALTDLEQLAEEARVEAQVRFVSRMLEEVQGLLAEAVDVPPELIVASFLEVLHAAMADQGPDRQRVLLQQAEGILRSLAPIDQTADTVADAHPHSSKDPPAITGPR